MGNLIPEICVCKEREGKSVYKKYVRCMFSDENVKIIDYTGIISPAKSLADLSGALTNYIPYELICVNDVDIEKKHSVVKVRCLNSVLNRGIFVKIVYISFGKFIISISSNWEEDDAGVMEYISHIQNLKNTVGDI